MTISKTAWQSFLAKYARYIQPNREGVTVDEVQRKVGIRLCVNDVLAQLRGTTISYVRDGEGRIHATTCRQFVENVFFDVFNALQKTDVEVYVVCLDAYGKRPVEKAATTAKRMKRARPDDAPEQLAVPEGQTFYFLDGQPMPGPVNLIFETPAAKKELYEYMTMFFVLDDVRERIPLGKRIILSGGLFPMGDDEHSAVPLEVTCTDFTLREEWHLPNIGEGDIDVWRWVYQFPEMDFHVCSHDADVILIGMLQMRRLLKKTPKRRGWVVTRRSVGSCHPEGQHAANLNKRHCLRKETYDAVMAQTSDPEKAYLAAGGSFAESSSTPHLSRRPVWAHYHIDLVSIYSDIVLDAFVHSVVGKLDRRDAEAIRRCMGREGPLADQFKEALLLRDSSTNADLIEVVAEAVGDDTDLLSNFEDALLENRVSRTSPNFVEIYVLAFILASEEHDYIQTKAISHNVGKQHVWHTFEKNMYDFEGLVEVYKYEMVGEYRTFHYVVDKEVLDRLIVAFYREKAVASIKEENKSPEQLRVARERSFSKSIAAYGPKEPVVWTVASQCVWLLQYWGNGPVPGYVHVNGASTDAQGRSVYGYTAEGWADSVLETGRKRICPPLPHIVK